MKKYKNPVILSVICHHQSRLEKGMRWKIWRHWIVSTIKEHQDLRGMHILKEHNWEICVLHWRSPFTSCWHNLAWGVQQCFGLFILSFMWKSANNFIISTSFLAWDILEHRKKCCNILRDGGCMNLWLIDCADKFAQPIILFCLSSILKEWFWPALIVLAVMNPQERLLKMNWGLYHLSSKVHVVLENGYPVIIWTKGLVSISTDLQYL
jgi:hypothetical protein